MAERRLSRPVGTGQKRLFRVHANNRCRASAPIADNLISSDPSSVTSLKKLTLTTWSTKKLNELLPLFPPQPHWLGNSQGCPPFDVLNSMLYEAVANNPSNTDKPQIIGKLILIGRTYSASVERRKTQGHVKDERQALEVIIAAAEAIAASKCAILLDSIGLNDKLTDERLPEAVAIHLELCQALATANNRENSSLASKYLHFHRPDFFPIVDSYVREGWSWLMDELGLSYRGWQVFGKVGRYNDWCVRVLELRTLMENSLCHTVSLRQVDNYLLSVMSLDGQGGWGLPRLPG